MTASNLTSAEGELRPPPRQSGSRVPGIVIRFLVVLLAAAIVAVFVARWDRWVSERAVQSTDDAYLQSDLTPLAARVAGHVAAVHVGDFARVRAGQVVAEIEDRDYRAALAEAEANVQAAAAAIENNAAQQDLQRAAIAAAEATAAATEADLDRYGRDLRRAAALVGSSDVSRQAYDQAFANQRRTSATLLQNRAQIESAHRQLAVLATEAKQLQAALAAQRAARDLAAINLDYTKVRAPVDGMVGQRQVRPGQYVGVGTELIALVPLPLVWVIANLKETQMTHIRMGNRADITVDSFPDMVLHGRVTGWSPASGAQFSLLPPDNATGNFTKVVQRIPVRVDLDPDSNVTDLLRPGMSVVVHIHTRDGA